MRKRLSFAVRPIIFLALLYSGVVPGWAGRLEVIWEAVKDDTLQSFGGSVSSAGDVNADGYDDIIVGSQSLAMAPNLPFTGRAYIYLGGPDMDTIPDVILVGETSLDGFGWSVSSAGDVNADGYDDVIVGAPEAVTDTSGAGLPVRRGKAYVYFGGALMDSIPDMVMKGQDECSIFGCGVSSAGDVNGDGYEDFVVGDYGLMVDHWDLIGAAFVYFGGPSVDIRPDVVLLGPRYNIPNPSNFGEGVSGAGDLNSDGYSDILVGAGAHTETYLWQGKVYVYFGGNPMDTIPDAWILGEGFAHFLGEDGTLSGAGDVNGDGYDDALIGSPWWPYGFFGSQYDNGKLYILFGGEPMESIPDWTRVGPDLRAPRDEKAVQLGMSVSGLGDLNGDGYDDIVAGAPAETTICGPMGEYRHYGRVYVFLGGSPMDTVENASLAGRWDDAYMGHNVVSAGDVDGDSVNEVLIVSTVDARRHCYSHVQICKWIETALVTDFQGHGGDGLARLDWSAEYENDTRGYNVYRSGSSDGTGWVRLNQKLITGAESYSYVDAQLVNDSTYYYWVEVMGEWGKADTFGSVSATPESLILSSFSGAKGAGRYVVLYWETENEPELLGWNIYRKEVKDSLPSEGDKLNPKPVPQRHSTYYWSDCWDVEEDETYFYWLSAVNLLGGERYFGPVEVRTRLIHLSQNTPNPFDSMTSIRYLVGFPCRTTLGIYDISGRLVKTLVDEPKQEGTYTVTWDGRDSSGHPVASGVYFYRLTLSESALSAVEVPAAARKMVLLR